MAAPSSLLAMLGDVPVGRLSIGRDGATAFRLLESYKNLHPRPVLGQAFLDDVDRVHRSRIGLPPWWSNLLPEGALRDMVAGRNGLQPEDAYQLLRVLRDDLPGNVILIDDEAAHASDGADDDMEPASSTNDEHPLKFSLAGVQLKFSVLRDGRGLTIPVSGVGGDWIVKLPDQRFPGVPANEFATMSWARASGVEVPEFDLVEIAKIKGLAALVGSLREDKAFAIRRFDRPGPPPAPSQDEPAPSGGSARSERRDQGTARRVHVEDFAQVLSVRSDRKYKDANYEQLARLLLAMTPAADFEQFVRRLVFVVASGNADAHLKNWSLIYRDGLHANLSPAYDLVSTIHYIDQDSLALNLGGSKDWSRVSTATFDRMARKLAIDPAPLRDVVRDSVEAVWSAWRAHRGDFGFSAKQRARIDRHLAVIPLMASSGMG